MKPFRLAAFAVALLLAACTTSPTDPARLDSAAPSFDEGPGMLGSGNNSDDGGNGAGSGNLTGDGISSDTTSSGGGTERGGGSLGSGN